MQMEMHYPLACYIVVRCWLLPHMLVGPQDGGEPPLSVLEGDFQWTFLVPVPPADTGWQLCSVMADGVAVPHGEHWALT